MPFLIENTKKRILCWFSRIFSFPTRRTLPFCHLYIAKRMYSPKHKKRQKKRQADTFCAARPYVFAC